MPPRAEAHPPVRSRCLHPGQQQGRRWPSSSSSRVLRMRRSRVSACFASSTQQMNSLRARGVMSLQAASAVELAISASRRSSGSLCTTPPGTRLLVTETSRSARATGGQAVRSPTVARPGRASREHPLLPPQVRRYLSACSDDPVPWSSPRGDGAVESHASRRSPRRSARPASHGRGHGAKATSRTSARGRRSSDDRPRHAPGRPGLMMTPDAGARWTTQGTGVSLRRRRAYRRTGAVIRQIIFIAPGGSRDHCTPAVSV